MALLVFCVFETTQAGTATWNGGGADNNWSSDANWNPSADPAVNDDLILDGSLRLTNIVNTGSGITLQYNSLTFGPTLAGTMLIGGGTLTNGAGGITVLDAFHSHQMTNTTFTLINSQTWSATSNSLSISAAIGIGGGGNILTISGMSNITLSGVVSSPGRIIKTGGGTLILSGNNNFSGGITNSGGTVESQSASGLGSGTFVMNGGILAVTTVDQSHNQIFNLAATSTNFVATGITFTLGNGADDLTGSGQLIKTGGGVLVLSNNNSFTGGISINAGTVSVEQNASLGAGTITFNGGTLFLGNSTARNLTNAINITANSVLLGSNGNDLSFFSPNISATAGTTLTFSNAGTIPSSHLLSIKSNSFSFAGDILLDEGSRIRFENAAGTNLFFGVISGSGFTNQTGANFGALNIFTAGGTTILSNANTYTSPTVVENGTLIIASADALGSSASRTVVTNGGTLAIMGGIAYGTAEPLTITSSGVSGQGAVNNIGGTNSYAGAISLAGNATLGSQSDKLTLSGNITNGSAFLTVTNAGSSTIVISGIVGANSGSGGLIHSGTGTLTLSGNNAFSGAVTNLAGTLDINHANALGTTTSIAAQGGTLLFNTGYTNTSATVLLSGGALQESDTSISLGKLSVSASSTIQLNSGGSAGIFRFADGTNTVGGGATLTIYGWSYDSATDSGSDDLIFFTSTTMQTATFLNNVTFFGLGPGARLLSTGELVPLTPEPGTLLFSWLLAALLGFRFVKKRKSIFKFW